MAGDGKDNNDGGTFARVAPYIAPGIGIIGGIAATAAGAPMVGVPLLTAGAAGAGAQAVKDFGGGQEGPQKPQEGPSRYSPGVRVPPQDERAMRAAVDKVREARRILVEGGNPLSEGARQQAINILGAVVDEADRVPQGNQR